VLEKAKKQLYNMSMLEIAPVLSKFPFVGICPCVDSFAIFRLEPMHPFSLGISKLIKHCAYNMLLDESRKSSSMLTAREAEPFAVVRRKILFCLNKFLREVEKGSAGMGLQVDFSKGECGGRLSGIFMETGILGMLETKDYNALDTVSPFIGYIIEAC